MVRASFSPRAMPGSPGEAGSDKKKSRRHPTHPTTRRLSISFNGLRAVRRRQVRRVGPIGCSIRRPDGVCLCERAVREAFGMLARDDCFGVNFGRRQAARLCIRGCFCMPENGQLLTYRCDPRRTAMQHNLPFPPCCMYFGERPELDLPG